MHECSEYSNQPVNMMQVVRQSGCSKKPVRRIIPLFSRKKYATTVNTVGNGVNFVLPFVHPDIQMGSNQWPDWYRVIYYATTYFSMKSDMNFFLTRRADSVSNELKQLHLRKTIEPIDPFTLRKE